ncbi:trafficking protein particle complex subunit 1 isoform X2 [Rhinolophus ferrumequinum]|uniref:trafficking protein particle complex subunit 1 isoform X2 n=1 Tax=Rhinolophus ferrumequinum TaxID=59479 RepID=UPI00140FA684|nr:trafficking protein particle complex subunit 1 isoform X2 [Rhinolophus ferrumequinum]
MTVHNLYLFDRNGVCLHYSEWHRKKQAGISKEEEYKLMKDGFLAFQTSRYKLHYYETPTGIKVVMNTDLGVGPIRDVLHHIYSALYVELVVKNPLCPLGQTVQSELFRSRLDSYIRSLPFFSARAG